MRGGSWLVVACALAGCGRLNFDDLAPDDALAPIAEPPRYLSGTRMRAVTYVTPGGSVLAYWYDSLLDIDCVVNEDSNGVSRCLPDSPTGSAYADAGCTVPLISLLGPGAMPACNRPPHVGWDGATAHELGAEWSGSVFSTSGCAPLLLTSEPQRFFEVGPLMPLDRFAAFTPVVRSGSQRLGYIQLVSEDGAQQRATNMFDTATGEPCTLLLVENGEYRCVPEGGPGSVQYRDPACTDPVLVVPIGARYAYTQQKQLCRDNTRIRELGPLFSGQIYQRRFGGMGCDTITLPGNEVHEPGADAAELFEPLSAGLEPLDNRLQLQVARTADGIVQPDPYLRDIQRGQQCTPIVDETSNSLVCAPAWGLNFVEYWAAAGCAGSTATASPSCRPESAGYYNGTVMTPHFTCEGFRYRITVFENPMPAPTWELGETGICTGGTESLFTSNRVITGSELPPMMRTRE